VGHVVQNGKEHAYWENYYCDDDDNDNDGGDDDKYRNLHPSGDDS
jgi:hypothetical protein